MLSHEVVKGHRCVSKILESVSFPCLSLSFAGQVFKFFLFSWQFRFLFSPFCLRNLFSLDVLPERSFGSNPFYYFPEDEHSPLLFKYLVLLFSHPTTSRLSPCSHNPQPQTSSKDFITVHFGHKMQAT
jgi:hypothetical protein